MERKGLIRIGQMAEMNHTTIATLRLYDKEGLLKPAYTDPETEYRYYDIRQNARLDLIAYMKELGMSLSEIRSVLKSGDLTRVESILSERNEQIYAEIRELEMQHNAVNRAIHAIERYRKSPDKGTISLEYIERRYISGIPCPNNFYQGGIRDFEDCLTDLRATLIAKQIPNIHTYSVGTSIRKEDFTAGRMQADRIFMFADYTLYKERRDIEPVDSGMYACIYADNFDDELSYASRLLDYCKKNNYTISGDYFCEIMSEFRIFDDMQRNMFLRLQVPIDFARHQ